MIDSKLPVTVLLAAKNEAINLPRVLGSLKCASRVIVLDSGSTDATAEISAREGAHVVQFFYRGGYPKKRQWAMESLEIDSPWVLLLDADEVVPDELWSEISRAVQSATPCDAYMVSKGFHFLGRRFRFGGFSHAAIFLLRSGKGRFEMIFDDEADGLDMEVHERVIVGGPIGHFSTPLIHEDFKGLEAYIARHNKYSTWEARVRHKYLESGRYGESAIIPNLFGNAQERRRFLKRLVIRMPFEPLLWFLYHYVLRLGFLEGRPGLIACQVRFSYIAQVKAKMYEMRRAEVLKT